MLRRLPGWTRRADVWAVGLIFMVAVGLRVVFYHHAPVFFEGDARGYLVRAVEVRTGDGFNFTLKRTPGYSLMIAAIFGAVGPSLEAVVAVQHLFGIGTALLAYFCARSIAGRAAGLLAGLATAASGSMLVYEHAILTESLFTLLLVASIWLLVVGLKRTEIGWFVAAGLVAGVGAIVRPVGLTLPLVVPLLSVVLRRTTRSAVVGGSYALSAGLLVMPWVVHNALEHGEAAPVHPGRFLIERTVKSNQTGASMYAATTDPDDPRLVREGQKILRDIEEEEPSSYEIHSALRRRLELSDAEASDLMWELATDAIRREPDVYLHGTWIELVALVRGETESVHQHTLDRRDAWKGEELDAILDEGVIPILLPEVWPEQEQRVPVAEALAGLYQPSHWIVLLLVGAALALIWGIRDPGRRPVLVPLGVVFGLVVCTVTVNGAYPRYRYPLDPLLHVTAAAGLIWTARAARAAGWLRRPSNRSLPNCDETGRRNSCTAASDPGMVCSPRLHLRRPWHGVGKS